MRRWMWILGGVLAAPLLLGAAVAGYGSLQPPAHTASAQAEVAAPPDQVFDLISTPARAPEWRTDVTRVEVEGPGRWVEHGGDPLVIELRESVPPRRYVAEVVDNPDFGGTWTWELAETDAGTRVTITEDGVVHSWLFRGVMHLTGSQTVTMRARLDDLTRHYAASKGLDRL